MMSHPLGRANKFPRKNKWGMVLNLTFVLEKKDAPNWNLEGSTLSKVA